MNSFVIGETDKCEKLDQFISKNDVSLVRENKNINITAESNIEIKNNTGSINDSYEPRKRTRATPNQLSILEETFALNPSPNHIKREQLARELGMPERSVQIWFQNRRAKMKVAAKKSSIIHDETLKIQQYASFAAAAACQANMFQQQQKNDIEEGDHYKNHSQLNSELYNYYYYYYFNYQQQQRQRAYQPSTYRPYYNGRRTTSPPSSLKTIPPPPPPPPPPPLTQTNTVGLVSLNNYPDIRPLDSSKWHEKQTHYQRGRAHTIGPYFTDSYSSSNHDRFPIIDPSSRSTSAEITYKSPPLNMIDNNSNLMTKNSVYSVQHEQLDFNPDCPQSLESVLENPLLTYPNSFTTCQQPYKIQRPCVPLYDYPFQAGTISTSHINYMQPITNDNVINISIESLEIGTWKRMRFDINDLMCQYDSENETFSWCIQDGLSQFKIEIPQSNILSIQLFELKEKPGWSRINFDLIDNNDNISFYMFTTDQKWAQCRDFTEDQQATLMHTHQLYGSTLNLKAELNLLLSNKSSLRSILQN